MKCQRCKWTYPGHNFVHPVKAVGHPYDGAQVCSICALEIHNEQKGTSHTAWPLSLAEIARQAALVWRERNPECAP